MTRQIRRIAVGVVVLFAALFVNLNLIVVLQGEDLTGDERNARGLLAEYSIPRGAMVAGIGAASEEVAGTVETEGRLVYERTYRDGPTYAHITGFHSFVYGRSELESSFNAYLTGSAPEAFARNLADLLAGRQRAGDTLQLTVEPAVQQAAADAIAGREGAVVALDPRSGAILALASAPSYDPNLLASHSDSEVREAWTQLGERAIDPRLNRAVRETYPPASTFKIVTAAAALERGASGSTEFPDPVRLELPLTEASIGNFGGGVCNDGDSVTLAQAMTVSCNTTFGMIGLDLGAEQLAEQAERFGFNEAWDLQIPDPATSVMPAELDAPSTAQSAIGQRDVRVSPLQMALVSAAVANDGVIMEPRIVNHVEDVAGRILARFDPVEATLGSQPTAMSRETAAELRDMLVQAVDSGTGRNAAIDGVQVAGKTGTAQRGDGQPPTVWFTGFAPAEDPHVAVAVVVVDADAGDTGGGVAAPIAREVMQAALTLRG